jgi:hypothetical protein
VAQEEGVAAGVGQLPRLAEDLWGNLFALFSIHLQPHVGYCLSGVQRAIHAWRETHIIPAGTRDVLEVYVLSKLWYLAQILPLPQAVAAKAIMPAGSFLWLDHLERLAWQELHGRRERGGLGLSCISTRRAVLLAKHLCHEMAAGGTPAGHLAFWFGGMIGHLVLAISGGLHVSTLPGPLTHAAKVLEAIFSFNTVSPSHPERATAARISAAFIDSPPLQGRG